MSASILQHNHFVGPRMKVSRSMLDNCPKCSASMAERDRWELEAVALYKEMLSSVPFYQARMHSDHFWRAYVGSRMVEAQELVKASKASSTAGR